MVSRRSESSSFVGGVAAWSSSSLGTLFSEQPHSSNIAINYTALNPLESFLQGTCDTESPWRRRGNGGIALHILSFGSSWRWVISFTPVPLYPRGKSLDSHRLGGWMVWTQWQRERNPCRGSNFGHFWDEWFVMYIFFTLCDILHVTNVKYRNAFWLHTQYPPVVMFCVLRLPNPFFYTYHE